MIPLRLPNARTLLLLSTSAIAMAFAQSANAAPLSESVVMANKGQVNPTNPNPGNAAANAALAAKIQQQLRQTTGDLSEAVTRLRTQLDTQTAARNAAQGGASHLTFIDQTGHTKTLTDVADGLDPSGLNPASGATPGSVLWQGADAPTETASNGKTDVTIKQTASQAILNWDSFNIGKNTVLTFEQKDASGQDQSSWVALNRVLGTAAPSQILGQIKAPGQIYILNQNGVIFGGSAQVNTGSLVAAAALITDSQFLGGIYTKPTGPSYNPQYVDPAFADAGGEVVVQAGAQITTNNPESVTQGGGFVLLAGTQVENAGTISTPQGQTVLTAGDDFIIRPGVSSTSNIGSTTRGMEVAATRVDGSANGTVINTGLVESPEGDITLTGHILMQDGDLLSTTSVSQRGTIHLSNSLTDTTGLIELGDGSLTTIQLDDSGDEATNAQRSSSITTSDYFPQGGVTQNPNDARLNNGYSPPFDATSNVFDRADLSRIEITTGGTIDFKGNSLTLTPGGQIAVEAMNRVQVDTGAILDVAGATSAIVPVSANQLLVNIQGNEQRDAPVDRDDASLNNSNVYVDIRDLVLVPASASYTTDRYYTPGGLLEVGGEIANTKHTIDEFMSSGGTIALTTGRSRQPATGSIVAQSGSIFNISGGAIQYAGGTVNTSWVRGADGVLYNVDTAPANLLYAGLSSTFSIDHPRWVVSDNYSMMSTITGQQYEDGYIVGRDAGRLILSSPTSVFEGQIVGDVVNGDHQVNQHPASVTDPYTLPQSVVAQRGILEIGTYSQDKLYQGSPTSVTFGDPSSVASGIGEGDAIPQDRVGTTFLSAQAIDNAQLGGLTVVADGPVTVDSALTLAPGGQLFLGGASIAINADVTAHSGSITISDSFTPEGGSLNVSAIDNSGLYVPSFDVADGVKLDTSGIWSNAYLDPADAAGAAFVNGGAITISFGSDLHFGAGSILNASSGAAVSTTGKLIGGAGGDISMAATSQDISGSSGIDLGATLQSYGVTHGGKLTLSFDQAILVTDQNVPSTDDQIVFAPSFFQSGFSNYDIRGVGSVTVADGTQVTVAEPTYLLTSAALSVPTGADPQSVMGAPVLQPLFLENPLSGTLTQRAGASITLSSGSATVNANSPPTVSSPLKVGEGASITVDPTQSITLQSYGALVVDGTLTAHGGSITLIDQQGIQHTTDQNQLSPVPGFDPTQPIWIGENAMLDASGTAYTALDNYGRTYGKVFAGGSIELGGGTGAGVGLQIGAPIVVRPGAVLDVSGASAMLDLGAGSTAPGTGLAGQQSVATNAGTMTFNSVWGIYLDGDMEAHAGGPNAQGGTLVINALDAGIKTGSSYVCDASGCSFRNPYVPDFVYVPSEIVLAQTYTSVLGDDVQEGDCVAACWLPRQNLGSDAVEAANVGKPAVDQVHLGVDQIVNAGFDSASLTSDDVIVLDGNVSLKLGRSLILNGTIVNSPDTPNAQSSFTAPYISLAGNGVNFLGFRATFTASQTPGGILTFNGDLIDVLGSQGFGDTFTIGQTPGNPETSITYDFPGFSDIDFVSQGDIRFGGQNIASNAQGSAYAMTTAGNLSFTAAQLYPITGQVYSFNAGARDGGVFAPGSSITINRVSDVDPQMPFEVVGTLSFFADIIEQGGIVRAPEGDLIFGSNSGYGLAASRVDFLPGSITSISMNGLMVPFGGTTDGVNYTAPVVFSDAFHQTPEGPNLQVTATVFNVAQGATVDLSGGGTLAGAGFISGRGGSTDTLTTPLFTGQSTGIYAIIPGYVSGYSPVATGTNSLTYSGSMPGIGQQITIPAGVPGLAAGTYTLLPSYFALMPGAFRVELDGTAKPTVKGATPMLNGSYQVAGKLGIANTGIENSLPTLVTVTSGQTVRTYSQYNEESYSQFQLANPAITQFGQVVGFIPEDGKEFMLRFPSQADGSSPLTFDGTGLFAAAPGGYSGSLVLDTMFNQSLPSNIEIVADGVAPTEGFISLKASALNGFDPGTMFIGGNNVGNYYGTNALTLNGDADEVVVRDGATLSAPQIFLMSQGNGSVTVEDGAVINTIGKGPVYQDVTTGYTYNAANGNVIAISNGQAVLTGGNSGTTGSLTVEDGATLYSEGSIAFVSQGSLNISTNANYGTSNLILGSTYINIGAENTPDAVVPAGLDLSEAFLAKLLAGNPSANVPPIEKLTLSAGGSINFFGSVDLNTVDPASGLSTLKELDLNTPAIYGYGAQGDVATLQTGFLVWNSLSTYVTTTNGGQQLVAAQPGGIIPNGPGTGGGTLNLIADRIVFGHPDSVVPDPISLDRYVFGFDDVNFTGNTSIGSNESGTLNVYQSQQGTGFTGTGGNLNLITPLMEGPAGAKLSIVAGGAMTLTAPDGVTPTTSYVAPLGAELDLTAASISNNTVIDLPTGILRMTADGDISLGAQSVIDAAGRTVTFEDQTRYTWGGAVYLVSNNGSVHQAAGSSIDFSATEAAGGILSVDTSQGTADLQGTITGSADAGFSAGGFVLRTNTLADFAGLNTILNTGGVYGARAFDIRTGDLTITSGELKAHTIGISVDGGSLTVDGLVDASGDDVGTIDLSARDDLTLTANAVLDAHGNVLVVDSYGQPIDASNIAKVALTTQQGAVVLDGRATVDVRSADDAQGHRGDVEINAPRVGNSDVAVTVSGTPSIQGAGMVVVNAFRTYTPGDGVIDQDYLNTLDADSRAYINSAESAVLVKLAPLGSNVHFRPGVEITSAGNLEVEGDLNLANYRYGPGATGNGAGEPGVLVIRAAGNLNVHGSITDGFGAAPETPDDNGWVIRAGLVDSNGRTSATTGPITTLTETTLGAGTAFAPGAALNFDLPILGSTLTAGTPLPGILSLTIPYTVRAGTPLPVDYQTYVDMPLPVGSPSPATFYIYSDFDVTTDWKVNVELSWYDYNTGLILDFKPGDTIPAGTIVPAYSQLPEGMIYAQPVTIPAYSLISKGAVLATDATYNPGTLFPRGMVFDTDVSVSGAVISANKALPAQVTLAGTYTLNQPIVATGIIQTAGHTYNKGDIIPAGTTFTPGTIVGVGSILPFSAAIDSMVWPAGAPLIFTSGVTATSDVVLAQDSVIPTGTQIVLPGGAAYEPTRAAGDDGKQGSIWALAPMLPSGTQSWSLQLVAGGDLGAADRGTLQSSAALGGNGNIVLADLHYGDQTNPTSFASEQEEISVIRTGTGSLSLSAGGSLVESSLFGVYTAGTQSPSIGGSITDPANPSYGRNVYDLADASPPGSGLAMPGAYADAVAGEHVYYPQDGGDLSIKAQGDFSGYTLSAQGTSTTLQLDSARIGNWLIRQGSDLDDPNQPTAWGISFGSYTPILEADQITQSAALIGFNGFGTLGGGNLTVDVGGDLGAMQGTGAATFGSTPTYSSAVNLAVAGTGRVTSVTYSPSGLVTGGTIAQTGGGDLVVNVGGTINPGGYTDDLDGTFTDTRGDTIVNAAAMGTTTVTYGLTGLFQFQNNALAPSTGSGGGGIVLAPGDGTAQVFTAGALVVDGAADPTRVEAVNGKAGSAAGETYSTGFSLWTASSEIDLESAGGDVVPQTASARLNANGVQNDASVDTRSYYPPTLKVVAASGSIYTDSGTFGDFSASPAPLETAPSPDGQMEFLAMQSIIAYGTHNSDPVSLALIVSGADASLDNISNPFKPAYTLTLDSDPYGSQSNSIYGDYQSLIAYGPDTITATHAGDHQPARFYAVNGNIVGLQYGAIFNSGLSTFPGTWYSTGKSAWLIAGGDIVQSGSRLVGGDPYYTYGSMTGLGVMYNANDTDVSLFKAGKDIVLLNEEIGGGGDLMIQAGGDIYQADKGNIESIGPIVNVNQSNRAGGASVEMLSGLGPQGANWTTFGDLYLDPANQQDTAFPLEFPQNAGKVPHVYTDELLSWMQTRYGYTGTKADVLAAFDALPDVQREVFLTKVYFDELDAADTEYNTPSSQRFQSYLRGRDAIATLFPTTAADGTPLTYSGNITMYGGSGVSTDFGGDIDIFAPGGATTVGVTTAAVPPSTAGLLTFGSGDINIYSLGSVLLGQSRIFTTFGGAITIWSAEGDINSGRGAKTTVVYQPPLVAYDLYGDITLSPSAPTTGAGIATLAPFAEVPPGNVYLVAPLGTIDAGEAGIRVSGNAYLAALHIVNADNIQVQGKAFGLPPKPVTNLALTTASNATTEAAKVVNALAPHRSNVVNVEVTGFGGDFNEPQVCVPSANNPCDQGK